MSGRRSNVSARKSAATRPPPLPPAAGMLGFLRRVGRFASILRTRRQAAAPNPSTRTSGSGNRRRPPDADAQESASSTSRSSGWRDGVASLGGRCRAGINASLASLRHRLYSVLRAAAVLVCIVGAVYLAREVRHYVLTAEPFAITALDVSGNTRLSEAEILQAAGLERGQNVFARSPGEATQALLGHPWIADAVVRRRLPGTFTLSIREHLPVAVLFLEDDGSMGSRGYLVGDEGSLFKEVAPGDPRDLPVVTGVPAGRFMDDPAFRSSTLLSVVALLHDWRAAGLWRRSPIAEIHHDRGDALSVYTGKPLFLARLGVGPYRKKLRQLRRVLDRLEEAKTPPEYIYLDNTRRPDRVTLRLRPMPELLELPAAMDTPESAS